MTEDEQSEWFARALDQFLFDRSDGAPNGLGSGDLTSLFDIARRRVDTARASHEDSRAYEATVWEALIARLENEDAGNDGSAIANSLGHGAEGLGDVISMRRRLAEESVSMAERHRDEVWRRVQDRLAETDDYRRTARSAPEAPAPSGEPEASSRDQGLDSLVRISIANAPALPRDPDVTQRLWARVGGRREEEISRSLDAAWDEVQLPASLVARSVGVAAVFALFIAAVAFTPSTGLGDHPIVKAITWL